MSRAFLREDAEELEELPDRRISPHPNDVTQEGLLDLEAMLNEAREAYAAALAAQDRDRYSTRIPRFALLERPPCQRSGDSRSYRYDAGTLWQHDKYPARGRKGADISDRRRR
jgi:hypothetical protein